jgi:hypothetical protein
MTIKKFHSSVFPRPNELPFYRWSNRKRRRWAGSRSETLSTWAWSIRGASSGGRCRNEPFWNPETLLWNDCKETEQCTLKIVNNCLNTNIYSYLKTSGVQSYNLYLNVLIFSTPVLIRHLWQLKTVVFLHRCLISPVPLKLLLFVLVLANRCNCGGCAEN